MIRSSLHPAPAFVLALAVGSSLAYLWISPEDSTLAAPTTPDDRVDDPPAIDSDVEKDAILDALRQAPPE